MAWLNTDSHNKGDCGTSFKSPAKLREFDNGPPIGYVKDDGEYIWPDAEAGNVIEFEVETKESDTCVAKLTTMDYEYIGKLTNAVTLSLGEDATPDQIMDGVLKELDISRFFVTVRSKRFTTNSSGKYTGKFTIENTFRKMPLILTLHYGYSGDAERSDLETAWEVIGHEVVWLIVEELVWILVCVAITAATGGVAGPAVTAIYVARAARWGARGAKLVGKGKKAIQYSAKAAKASAKVTRGAKAVYYSTAAASMIAWAGAYMWQDWVEDAWGLIDVNKSGCQFPQSGYNDIYTFQVGGGDEQWLAFLSTMTPESMGYATTGVETQSVADAGVSTAMSSPFIIYTGIALVGIVVMLLFSKEGGEE